MLTSYRQNRKVYVYLVVMCNPKNEQDTEIFTIILYQKRDYAKESDKGDIGSNENEEVWYIIMQNQERERKIFDNGNTCFKIKIGNGATRPTMKVIKKEEIIESKNMFNFFRGGT